MQLKDIADFKGLSGPLVFAVDSKTQPGKVIVHCVRLETFHMEDAAFDRTKFNMLHLASDRRVVVLASCFGA